MSIHLLSSSSDDDSEDEWEHGNLYLRPGDIWIKPLGRKVIITTVSITVKPENADGARGVLVANPDETPVTIAALTPHNPSQITKLIWNSAQEMSLYNEGNCPVSIVIMTKPG